MRFVLVLAAIPLAVTAATPQEICNKIAAAAEIIAVERDNGQPLSSAIQRIEREGFPTAGHEYFIDMARSVYRARAVKPRDIRSLRYQACLVTLSSAR